KSGTVIWNGPMGMYEQEPFSGGSKAVAAAVSKATENGVKTIIGGGDTIDLHVRYSLPIDSYTWVSTGGGAMLEFISGQKLPALEALV
ncbi:phosphoglycerate kinase, partial [Candidatus Peregrinibacteria bacterium]|nr:phosphoglycerate kinase [Candidatus Peregrinibacteria bacterium]